MRTTKYPLFFQVCINDKKHYLLGTCHSLPISVLPQQVIEMVEGTSILYCESGYTSCDLTYFQFIEELKKTPINNERINFITFIEVYYTTPIQMYILQKIQNIVDISNVVLDLKSIEPIKVIHILKYIGMDSSLKRAFQNLGKRVHALDSIRTIELMNRSSTCSCSPFCDLRFSSRYIEEDILNIYIEESCTHDRTGIYNQFRNNLWVSFMLDNMRISAPSTYAVGSAHIFGILQLLLDNGALIHRVNSKGALIKLDFSSINITDISREIRMSFSPIYSTYLSYKHHIEKEIYDEDSYLECADKIVENIYREAKLQA